MDEFAEYTELDEMTAEALCVLIAALIPGRIKEGDIYPIILQHLAETTGNLIPDNMQQLAEDILELEDEIKYSPRGAH